MCKKRFLKILFAWTLLCMNYGLDMRHGQAADLAEEELCLRWPDVYKVRYFLLTLFVFRTSIVMVMLAPTFCKVHRLVHLVVWVVLTLPRTTVTRCRPRTTSCYLVRIA